MRRLSYAAEAPRRGCRKAEGLVGPLGVVLFHEPVDYVLELRRHLVLRVPQALRLQRPELPLHQHVVFPAGLAVHALHHMSGGKQRDVLLRAEDRPLAAVHDGRRAVGLEGAHSRRRRPRTPAQCPTGATTLYSGCTSRSPQWGTCDSLLSARGLCRCSRPRWETQSPCPRAGTDSTLRPSRAPRATAAGSTGVSP